MPAAYYYYYHDHYLLPTNYYVLPTTTTTTTAYYVLATTYCLLLVSGLRASFSHVRVVLAGSESSWQYEEYPTRGLFDERMEELRVVFADAGLPVFSQELQGVRLADSIGHMSASDE